MAWKAPATAASRSASAKMTFGLLPPSSNVVRFRVSAAAFWMILAVSTCPVKAILSTSGWATRAAPVVSPRPLTMLMTPAGKPASRASSATRSAVSGVCSAGFITIVLPQASAGPHFQASISSGKFQGMICPTTPIGWRSVYDRKLPRTGIVRPSTLSAQPA